MLDPVETLSKLVATASVNPMGRECLEPPFGEGRLTELLEDLARRLHLPSERQPVEPGRENLIVRLEGDVPPDQGGTILLLDAHQDTVPVDGMTIEPFRPQIRDGRLYGRGACDTKSGMAAMLAAVSRLAAERPTGMPTVVLSFTVNEENGFTGAAALARLWTEQTDSLIARRPDAAVVAEPTALDVVVAHKGVIRWRCHTTGRAAHSARPQSGKNAIYRMARVIAALEQYAADEVGSPGAHPLCGPATLSVGTIHGGLSVNTVPDRCTIELDCRVTPGTDPRQARRRVIDYLGGVPQIDFPLQHDSPFIEALPLPDEQNGSLAGQLAQVATEVTGRCQLRGAPYATNAACFAAAGVPTVVCGPGFLEQAHTEDEWAPLDQVNHAAEIYYRFCRWLAIRTYPE